MSSDLYDRLPRDSRRIRILTIIPHYDEATQIKCILAERDLDDNNTKFDALSYCWGDPSVTRPITVNGHERQVTTNLDDALRQFRSDSYPGSMVLWADAVCINQDDVEEKGHQVQLMGDVYRRASAVRAWIGSGGSLERRALQTMERWSQCPCNGKRDEPCDSSGKTALQSLTFEDYKELHFISVIFQAAYWERLWVVQELIVTENVLLHLGPHQVRIQCFCQLGIRIAAYDGLGECRTSLSRDDGASLIECLKSNFASRARAQECPSSRRGLDRILIPLHHLGAAQDFRRYNYSSQMSGPAYRPYLAVIIGTFSGRKAYDPRDYIYGLLGMLGRYSGITPDYTKTAEEVFEDAAVQIMKLSNSVDILQQAASGNHRLPSWAPDFGVGKENVRIMLRYCQEMIFCEDLPSPQSQICHPRRGVLKLQGILFDRIISVSGPPLAELTDSLAHRAGLRSIHELLKQPIHNISNVGEGQGFLGLKEMMTSDCWFSTAMGYTGLMLDNEAHTGDFICVFSAPACRLFCLRPAQSNIELAYSLVGACTLLRDIDPHSDISPLAAIREVVNTKYGGIWPVDGFFSSILLV